MKNSLRTVCYSKEEGFELDHTKTLYKGIHTQIVSFNS